MLHPLFWFVLSTMCFYIAVQRPRDYTRQLFGLLQIFSTVICLGVDGVRTVPFAHIWAPFVMGITMHTLSILFLEGRVCSLGTMHVAQRLRIVFRIWSNVRRIPLVDDDDDDAVGMRKIEPLSRYSSAAFAITRCLRILVLSILYRVAAELVSKTIIGLNITIRDFAPSKQGLLPSSITYQDLCLRAVMAVYWIWSTYAILTGAHDLMAIFFVCLLGWDLPVEWPALFGSITEAYSLRRFWGSFWQRLHVEPFAAYMPPFLVCCEKQQQQHDHCQLSPRLMVVKKALRALWMFLMSAVCHAAINWVVIKRGNTVQEFRFFVSNYVICLVETALQRTSKRTCFSSNGVLARLFGYAWVFVIFFSLVPAWQYSLIYV